MQEIVQRVVYENVGVDGIVSAIDDMTAAYKEAEKAKDGAFDGLAKQATDASKAVAETADNVDKSANSLSRWEKINKSASNQLKTTVDRTKIFGVELGTIREKVAQARASVASFGKTSTTAGSAAAKGGKAAAGGFSIARIGAIALQVAMGPIGIILALVAAGVAVLTVAAQRSQPVIDALGQATAVVGAVFDVFLDRVTSVGEALFFFGTGQYGKAFDSLKASVSGLNAELSEEISLSLELEKGAQRRAREEINLDIKRANSLNTLKELNLIVEDISKTDAERLAASIESEDVLSALQAETIRLREEEIASQLGLTEVTDDFRAKLGELGKAGIVFQDIGQEANDLSIVFEKFGIGENTLVDAEKLRDSFVGLKNEEAGLTEIQTTASNKRRQIERDALNKRLKAIEDRKKAEQDLADFRTQLAGQITQLAIDESEGAARIALEKKVALQQIQIAEDTAREKFKAAKEVFDLENEFAELREGVERDAAKRTSEFKVAEAKKEIETQRDIDLARLELSDITGNALLNRDEVLAVERNKIVRKSLQDQLAIAQDEFGKGSVEALVVEVQIQAIDDSDSDATDAFLKRTRDEALAAVDSQSEIARKRIDIIAAGSTEEAALREGISNQELTLEQSKEREKTQILLDALVERRDILLSDPLIGEDSPSIQLLNLEEKELQNKIDGLDNVSLGPLERIKARIQEAFNLDDETTALLVDQAKGAFDNIVSGLESIYERQLIENDKLIEQIDERVDVLQSALDDELSLQEQGLANNAGLAQAALDEELARKEEANEKRLAIERKAARLQIIIDTAQQASSLALSIANLLAVESLKGLPGILIAGTLGAALIFSTIAKAKAQAAQFSNDIPTFRGGTASFAGVLSGPSHEGGGILGRYTQGGNTYVAEMEGGEAVTPVRQSQQFGSLLEAIRTDKIGKLSNDRVLSMLGRNPATGIAARSQGYSNRSYEGLTPKDLDVIVSAIQGQVQAVTNRNGDVVFVDPTGNTMPYVRPLR